MKKSILSFSIFVFIVIISVVSCKQEDAERNSEKSALDPKFLNDWYADSINPNISSSQGELEYSISATTINKIGSGVYKYSEESTVLLANGVYQVEAPSNSGGFYYLKEGKSDNELMISMKTPNSSFERVCQDSYLCMAGLPKSFVFDQWHQLGASSVDQKIVFEDNGVRINTKKYFEVFSEMINASYFKLNSAVDTTDPSDKSTAIYLEQKYGPDSIRISESDSLSFETYYRYSGISVGEVEQDNGIVLSLQSGANWEEQEQEQENNSKIGSFTEKSRTDWTIILVDDDGSGEIEIDVKNKVVNRINKDGSRTKLTDVIAFENRISF